jgi:hypothetical protein
MSGRVTLLSGENLTITTAVNVLAALQTAAAGANLGQNVSIRRLEVWQTGTTTLGMVRGEIATRTTAGTLTATSKTPSVVGPVGGAVSGFTGNTAPAGGTARSGINATVDSGGTYTQVMPFGFANTSGYLFKPDPEEEIWFQPSTLFVVRFLADPSALTGWGFNLWLREE